MAPILLDSRSLFKLSSFVLSGMIVMFAGGYLLGYEAAVDLPDRVTVRVAALPDPATVDAEAYAPQVPEVIEPGLNIDVDLPDPPAEREAPVTLAAETVRDEPASQDVPAKAKEFDAQHHEPLQVALLELPAEVASDVMSAPAMIEAQASAGNPQPAMKDTAAPESARYSVQVGMFADRTNAERNLRRLESLDLSAYIDAYTNGTDETRFNVRFGWFASKADAVAALSVYENTHGGAGYVVRLARENPTER